MKRIFVLGLFALLTAGANAAGNPEVVNEKVLQSFKETFTNAQKVKWFENDNSYSVRFYQGETRYIVYYNKKGHITGSMKFYQPALLPTNILADIAENHSDKTSFMVTEISSGSGTAYFVKMEGKKHWFTIRYEGNGDSSVYEKVRKQ
ncbi:MAG: hypothetical protein KIT80_02660 [Chitinophagaceae bacterium]|nr:hypothetical protein [Chitinophagaceae bacterium]MCW5925788.1 hypothetical protein [Chitinophagaceae bacterium]